MLRLVDRNVPLPDGSPALRASTSTHTPVSYAPIVRKQFAALERRAFPQNYVSPHVLLSITRRPENYQIHMTMGTS